MACTICGFGVVSFPLSLQGGRAGARPLDAASPERLPPGSLRLNGGTKGILIGTPQAETRHSLHSPRTGVVPRATGP